MTPAGRVPTAILISGRGSNMAALLEAAGEPGYPAEMALVVSNRPEAGGLERARADGIETAVLDHRGFPDRESFDGALDSLLRARGVELVCLAGFMRVLTDGFVRAWAGRLLNIHPSLLPAYKGLHTHRRALADRVVSHGCTVHQVVPELDSGPVVARAEVPVLPGDTEEALAARVLGAEHRLYPTAVAEVARALAARAAAP